jgi:triacylglycerol lipase
MPQDLDELENMKIVLVHGIYNTGRIFFKMRRIFEKNGYNCFTPDLKPLDGRYGLDDLGEKLKVEINKNIGEKTKFVLIGFSMGGIVSRYYLQELGGFKRIKQFFTISTLHNGSYLAYLYPGEGAKHLRPNSQFLRNLELSESILNDIKVY